MGVVLFGAAAPQADGAAGEALVNSVLGDPVAIAEGRRLYGTRCVLCHGSAGGRGPNLFASSLSDEQFLETVISGRKGTQMPAFGFRMSSDEAWQIYAFVKSTDHY